MSLEGKKKFIATVTAVVAAVVGALATQGVIGQGTSETATQLLAIAGPLILGFLYDLIQGWHDGKKEQVKIETAKAEAQKQITLPLVQYVEEKLAQPFDPQSFDQKVKQYASSWYGEVNNFTELYSAQALGRQRRIEDIDQAVDYWAYLYNKGNEAFRQKFGFDFSERNDKSNLKTVNKQGQLCTFPDIRTMASFSGADYIAILREMEKIEESRKNLDKVKEGRLDWSKLADTSYYGVGTTCYLLFSS
jgi:hypothetical protein